MDRQTDTIYNKKELDDLRRQTINWYASARQEYFQKIMWLAITP